MIRLTKPIPERYAGAQGIWRSCSFARKKKRRQSLELTGNHGGPVSLKYANLPIEEVDRWIEDLLAEGKRGPFGGGS